MKPIDIFAKRLDEIFEMGDPTKALIYDAFHKATEPFPGFWERLKTFVEAVQVNDQIGEEEREMIIKVCNFYLFGGKNHNIV